MKLTSTYSGILVAYLFCLATRPTHNSAAWRIPIALGLIFAVILGVGILFMPESPRWLLRHDREEEARRALSRVYPSVGEGPNTVEGELREMKAGIIWERQQPKATWSDIFRPHNKTLYRTLLGMSLQSVQQLTGVNGQCASNFRPLIVRLICLPSLLLLRRDHLPQCRD